MFHTMISCKNMNNYESLSIDIYNNKIYLSQSQLEAFSMDDISTMFIEFTFSDPHNLECA